MGQTNTFRIDFDDIKTNLELVAADLEDISDEHNGSGEYVYGQTADTLRGVIRDIIDVRGLDGWNKKRTLCDIEEPLNDSVRNLQAADRNVQTIGMLKSVRNRVQEAVR